MKLTNTFLPTLSIAALAMLAACSAPTANTPVTGNSNTATVVNNNAKPADTPAPTLAVNAANNASNAKSSAVKTPAASSGETRQLAGRYQIGKTESLILYVGMETGDYAAYCFENDSEAAREIAAACKNGDECEVNAEMGEGSCKVPGLEADLSDSGRIARVVSAKSLAPPRKAK